MNETASYNGCARGWLHTPGAKSAKFLETLLSEKEHWLPSLTGTYIHLDNQTTNRVEGFFGTLENLLEHNVQTLANVVKAMYVRAERLWIRSRNDKQLLVPIDLMSSEDSKAVGSYALAIILAEFNDLREKGALTTVYSQECCTNHILFNLPCRHLMLERMQHDHMPLLTLQDIPLRWRHDPTTAHQTANAVDIVRQPSQRHGEWDYKSCIDKFDRYFSVADRSEIIRNILDRSLSDLESVEVVQADTSTPFLPPGNLLIPGRPYTHPRANVDFAGPRPKRRKYRCSVCGSKEHTAPRCPKTLSTS